MFLKNNFKKGDKSIPHDWLNTIANFWNFFTVTGGTKRATSDGHVEIIIPYSATDIYTSFWITDAIGTTATMQAGTFYRDGTPKTIIGLPATFAVPENLYTHLRYDTQSGTVQWLTGTAHPASSGTLEYYPVHVFESDGTNIGTILHEHPANFHTFSPYSETATGTWQTVGTLSEHADSAGTDTWTKGTNGLKIVFFDLGYDHTAGTPRIYGVKRQGTFDKYGHFTNVGTETLIDIDTPISHALLGT